ncbi:hypothetical protein [Methanothermococcus okinawensis]|uniref:Uncharacterized protein n=1 Tax=Methanothermococcus okinawensis (strain DSM 14208 / JCM 11175 / IH1) TaxID=647113 RepID=F8AKG4_METOI|nr:hypothetical protein [Methanothermococcus okinawensis]AEH07490.1 hypothetical protein Metok_1527 [Methanothermococcus okinawensis IH1]
MKKIDSVFVSTLYYGINKAVIDIMGTGGMVLGRRTSYYMIKLLKDMNILKEKMNNEEIRDLFVNTFGLSEDLVIEDNEDEVIFNVVNPTLDLFLGKIMEEGINPYVCPFIHLLSSIYEETGNSKLMLKQVIPEHNKAKLIFKKIK